MDAEDLILVSVDDHVVEPPTVFEGRLPAKYVDLAPKFVTRADGTSAWLYEGAELGNIALNSVAGRPPDEYGMEPTSFDEIRPGCWDIDERVADMDANGVLGSLCFPSFPQFCGQLFARTQDKDVALAMVQAYNDWHIDEWCGSHPGRFIPCSLPAIERALRKMLRALPEGKRVNVIDRLLLVLSDEMERLRHPQPSRCPEIGAHCPFSRRKRDN